MAKKHIVSLGFDFPGGELLNVENISFKSNKSLCDADIIILEPCILDLYRHSVFSHLGKPVLDADDRFVYTENRDHWRQELNLNLEDGKTIFIFLSTTEEFYRSSIISHNAELNYNMLPITINNLESKSGNQIKIAQNLGCLSTYWHNFSQYSKYKVCFELDRETTFLSTKTGNRAVGAIIPVKNGNLVLLPHLEFDEQLEEYDEDGELYYWNNLAVSHGKKLQAAFIEIDKVLRSGQANTPPPEWSQKPNFKLASELKLEKSISETKKQIEELQQKLDSEQAELDKQGRLRWLLFETGKPLEAAILEALQIMGFNAENYQDDELEFDAVFVSKEGRFIGEAEGKDNKAINVAKFSQLEREIQENFAREEVTKYAKGVLFGNADRLKELEQRAEFFTKKCILGAERLKIALIRTPDLFPVAKYLKENNNSNFAKLCREAIANTEGKIVEFPIIP
ncbi:MAG: hypothetical protein AAFQ80_16410 [Cyanobacteria bacterium J06621_8]